MASYEQIASMYDNEIFMKRLAVAVVKAANAIKWEPEGTSNHANRLIWSNQVWATSGLPYGKAREMFNSVIANSTIEANGIASTDTQIQDAVNGLIDTYATGS